MKKTSIAILVFAGAISTALAQAPSGGSVSGVRGKEAEKVGSKAGTVSGVRGKEMDKAASKAGQVSGVRGMESKANQPH